MIKLFLYSMIHPIHRCTIIPLLKLFLIKEVKGIGNLPQDGKFVVTPNHQSFFDDWVVPIGIVLNLDKKLHMYANRNYFKNPLFKWYLNHTGSIPVEVHYAPDKKEINEKAFQKALQYLQNKEPICIYPEGHRSPDGKLQEAKVGAAHLALAAKVPILPIGIMGSKEVLPKGKKFPRIKKIIQLNIGKPIYLDKYYGKENNKKVLKEVTTLIMKEIGKLTNLEYNY